MEKLKFVLRFVLLHFHITIGYAETVEATINIQYEPRTSYMFESRIYSKNYQSFQDVFFNPITTSVFLKYQWDTSGKYIHQIQSNNNVNQVDNLYFNCSNNRSTENIDCYRNIRCSKSNSKSCAGVGILWAKDGEYLNSKHWKNSSVNCSDGNKATCYNLVNQDDSTTVELSTTSASSVQGNTDFVDISSTTTLRYTSPSQNYSSTLVPTSSFLTTTSFPVDQKPNSSSSDSTGVIAGVTVGIVIVIIIVILIVVICKRRKLKKESTSNTKTSAVKLVMNPNTNSSNRYTKKVPSSENHNINKSTVSTRANNEQSTQNSNTNTNSYSNTPDYANTVNTTPHSISDSDYTCIGEDQSSTLPDRLLSTDIDSDGCYNTINDDINSVMFRPVTQDVDSGYCSIDGNNSRANHVLPFSPQEIEYEIVKDVQPVSQQEIEYEMVNENDGYTNFTETLADTDHPVVRDYITILDDRATIGGTEPAKNLYSIVGENIRHFENTYGDSGVSMQAGKDNSKLSNENTYFILEAEENLN